MRLSLNKLCRTGTPFGTAIVQVMSGKKLDGGPTPWPTGSPLFGVEKWGRVYAHVAFERTPPRAFVRMSYWSLPTHLHMVGSKSYWKNCAAFCSLRPVEPQTWPLFGQIFRHQKCLLFAQTKSDFNQNWNTYWPFTSEWINRRTSVVHTIAPPPEWKDIFALSPKN